MDPSNRRTSSVTFLLVGLVMLIGLAMVFVAVVPTKTCPNCQVEDRSTPTSPKLDPIMPCDRCGYAGRITLQNLWLKGREPAPE